MRSFAIVAALAAVAVPAYPAAEAQTGVSHAHVYQGRNRTYRYRCKRSKGTTGLIAGAGGGGLGAAALGAGPIGIAAGVIGGGLLGRHLDKRHDAAQNRRNGC